MNPLVVSYDNCPTDNTLSFKKTLENNGWTYKLIGEGEEWKGLITRVAAYNNFLKTLDPTTVVVLSDARDVVCVRSPKAFLDGWKTFKRDVVVSMELFCDSKTDVPDDYKGGQCVPLINYWKSNGITHLPPRKFVNAGLVAGRVGELCRWLQWTLDNKYENDQLALCNYMNTYPDRIAVDTSALLLHSSTFGVNAGMQTIFQQGGDAPTLAELYGRGAFFLHIPGCSAKGQATVYNDVCAILNFGLSDKKLRTGYSYGEPPWLGYSSE
jgi:hypothetical protein